MDKTNNRKTDQLWMPIGTATSRLRKMILFSVLSKHGENICHQCGNVIGSADELSIEHVKPWLDISPELFWDLSNIAFSHLKCNCAASVRVVSDACRRATKFPPKIGPEGTAWCNIHRCFLPVEKFSRNRSNWNGLQNRCDECRSKSRSAKTSRIIGRPRKFGADGDNRNLFSSLEG